MSLLFIYITDLDQAFLEYVSRHHRWCLLYLSFPAVAVASLLYAAVYIVTVTSSSLSKTPLHVIGKYKTDVLLRHFEI